ncbi:MAG: class I SAM-dependent methyltransferase [Desulfobacter sp.]
MKLLVTKWDLGVGDHLWLEDSQPSDYIDNVVCEGCRAEMVPISQIENSHGAIGLRTGYCPTCGYIKRIRNLPLDWYKEHFSKRWLKRREEDVVENIYLFERLKPYIKPKGAVLDIGCGLGEMLLAFKHLNYDTYGVEPSEERGGKAQKYIKNVMIGTGEKYLETCSRKFDVISFFNVLQFVSDPFYLLGLAADKLNDGGLIFMKIGLFHKKNSFCQFSHLGVIHSSLSLYTFQMLLKEKQLVPIAYSEYPHEIILKKDTDGSALDTPNKIVEKMEIKDIENHVGNSLNIKWLRLFKRGSCKFHGRTVYLKSTHTIRQMLPVRFVYNTSSVPILLK